MPALYCVLKLLLYIAGMLELKLLTIGDRGLQMLCGGETDKKKKRRKSSEYMLSPCVLAYPLPFNSYILHVSVFV